MAGDARGGRSGEWCLSGGARVYFNGRMPVDFLQLLTRPIARESFFRKRTICDGVHPSRRAAWATSPSNVAMASSASANRAGKSSCEGGTRIRPPTDRALHRSLGWYSASTGRRTSRARLILSRNMATRRFAAWLRRSHAWALTPVGECSRRTPVSTLLRCCPPGPERRRNSRSHSRKSSSVAIAAGCGRWSGIGGALVGAFGRIPSLALS